MYLGTRNRQVEFALLKTLCVRSLLTLDRSATFMNDPRCNDDHVWKLMNRKESLKARFGELDTKY